MPRSGQIASCNGPMNRDFDFKVVQTDKGEVFERINLRPNSINKRFSNQKITGNTKIETTLPTGTNKNIGWIVNAQRNAFLYFIFNSNSNHCIYRYFVSDERLEKVWFSEPSLELEDSDVRGFVAEGDLYWVNGGEHPKSFNIDRAVNYTNTTAGEAYSDADKPFENIFPWIKRPPRYSPVPTYDTISSQGGVIINFNNLRGKQWQFKYNYKYKNNQESSYSSISKVPLAQGEIKVEGEWIDDLKRNNVINLVINTGGSDVKEINVAVRDSSALNSGSFFVFERIKKYKNGSQVIADDIDYTIKFLNNTPKSSIDTDLGNRYFDDVPLSGTDSILLDGKWSAIAKPQLGYDAPAMTYGFLLKYTDIDFDSEIIDIERAEGTVVTSEVICNDVRTSKTIVDYTIPALFYENSIYQISVPRASAPENVVTAVYPTDAVEPANQATVIRDSMYTQLKNGITNCDVPPLFVTKVGSNIVRLTYYNITGGSSSTGNITTSVYTASHKTLKRGHYHPFAVVYDDGFGRYNVAYGDQELFIPDYDGTEADYKKAVTAQLVIYNIPPIQAKTYRIAYNRFKSYTYFLYVPVVEQIIGDGLNSNGVPVGSSFLKINQAVGRIIETFPHSQLAEYVWKNGDRVKRPGYDGDFQVTEDFTRKFKENEEDMLETGFIITGQFDTIAGTEKVELIEIYRPNTEPIDNILNEISEEFAIIDPGTEDRFHAGNIQDQGYFNSSSIQQPAVIDLDFGDVFLKQRLSADTASPVSVVESIDFSDYYKSSGIDSGRVVSIIELEQKIINRVQRGENYLENTLTNRLNVFLAGTAVLDVSDVYGDIVGIMEVGDVMKVLQEHKETSVYVGKLTAKEADGMDMILLTDRVFGAYHRYVENVGVSYRRSMQANERYLYYFDGSTGDFMRSATNGQISISKKYNMQSWFEAKAKELRRSDLFTDVIVGINTDYQEVLITFIIGDTCETLVFSEDENNKGWMYFLTTTLHPENYAFYGDSLFSFRNGEMWVHNEGNYNSFFGVTEPASLSFVCNGDTVSEKRLGAIELDTTKNIWNIEITTKAGLNYGAQKTILSPSIMRQVGNRLVSDILRNIIGPSGVEDLQLLYNGHEMVGDNFLVRLYNSDGEEVFLNEAIIKYITST